MKSKISRRDFLKLSGAGLATAGVLTGCGPTSRYVVRQPYSSMPEFGQTGVSTYYATTCRDCTAGCGIIVRTVEGRAIKAEGNPAHPVSRGKICQRALTAVQGLYNPDRITGPRRQARGGGSVEEIDWDQAVEVVGQALQGNAGSLAFLLGGTPDHLFDLVTELAEALGAPPPVRYSTLQMFEGRSTLIAATEAVYGTPAVPHFDMANSDVVFSFGANLLEEWLSPLAYMRQFRQFRQDAAGRRTGYLVTFEPRQSVTGGSSDLWVPVAPGSEGLVAAAIGRLAAEARGGGVPPAFAGVDVNAAAEASGVPVETLTRLAEMFATARQATALPGGNALGHANGLESAVAILTLNSLSAANPVSIIPVEEEASAPQGSLQAVQELVDRMRSGQVSTLFIHGVNPLFELPSSLGFAEALAQVPQVISFASFPDETALASDYILPDHTGLESFGYQRVQAADRPVLSAMQPVVVPLYNTRATADVLLAATQQAGAGLDNTDEVAFIQSRLRPLLDANDPDGLFRADEMPTFWAQFLQYGGWWTQSPRLEPAEASASGGSAIRPPEPLQSGQLHFIAYPNKLGDGSVANRPWIQETPDPMVTATWNSYLLIHPDTAAGLGVRTNDVVLVRSEHGELETSVYVYPAIRPDTVAMPFGQGHTELGRWAAGRGANPAVLFPPQANGAGDLAFADTRVTLSATGRRRPLALIESLDGVYGEGH